MESQIIPEMIDTKINNKLLFLKMYIEDDYQLSFLLENTEEIIEYPNSIQLGIESIKKLELIKDFMLQIPIKVLFDFLKDDKYEEISKCHLFDMLIYQSVLKRRGLEWYTKVVLLENNNKNKRKVI